MLAAGSLPVGPAQIPFNIRDGRLRFDATTLDAGHARVIVSGGYDMLADQADVRLSFSANAIGPVRFAKGQHDGVMTIQNWTIDVDAADTAIRAPVPASGLITLKAPR